MNKNIMIEIVENIVESADTIKKQKSVDDQDYGQLLAYAECLSIIRDACSAYNLSEIGLDFDIDKRYL